MVQYTHSQRNFTAGEISPRLFGQTDLSKYQNGLATMENFISQLHGGATRRSGTRFVNEVKDSNCFTRLIPFEPAIDQAFVVELGELYARFYKNRTQVRTDAAWFTLTIDEWEALTVDEWAGMPIEAAAVEIVSPWDKTQTPDLKVAQSVDVMFLCHPKIRPKELRRISDISWTIVDFDFKDGPYIEINPTLGDPTPTTLTPAALTGATTLTASAVTGINDDAGFLSTDVDRLVRIQDDAGNWTWGRITAVTSTVLVGFLILGPDFSSTSARDTWRLGAWSDTTGFPHVPIFHQGRLWFGATDARPDRLYGSVVDNFNLFQPTQIDDTVAADDAIFISIRDNKLQEIMHLESDAKGLIVLTGSGEFLGTTGTTFDPLTPGNFTMRKQNTKGSRRRPRVNKVGSAVLFAQRAGFRMRELLFNFDSDQYLAPDLTLLAEHITTDVIADTDYQQEPSSTIWAILDNGTLLGMTYERSEDVVGWHRHPIGGSFGTGGAVVESLAIIPDKPHDLVWLIVKRTINSVTRRYVEFIEDRFNIGDDQEDAYFVDGGRTYDSVPATVINGLDHLEGETVSILADGAVHPDRVVAAGTVTLDRLASTVHTGLAYPSRIKTLPLVNLNIGQETQAQLRQIGKTFIQFHLSLGGQVGFENDDNQEELEDLIFREAGDPAGQPPPLFTGLFETTIASGSAREPQVIVQQLQPLPMTVLSLQMEFDLGGN